MKERELCQCAEVFCDDAHHRYPRPLHDFHSCAYCYRRDSLLLDAMEASRQRLQRRRIKEDDPAYGPMWTAELSREMEERSYAQELNHKCRSLK